jgi:hypothetical protein
MTCSGHVSDEGGTAAHQHTRYESKESKLVGRRHGQGPCHLLPDFYGRLVSL